MIKTGGKNIHIFTCHICTFLFIYPHYAENKCTVIQIITQWFKCLDLVLKPSLSIIFSTHFCKTVYVHTVKLACHGIIVNPKDLCFFNSLFTGWVLILKTYFWKKKYCFFLAAVHFFVGAKRILHLQRNYLTRCYKDKQKY